MPKEPAGVALTFCPYGRIDKDKLGKLFALANQQYEPLFVRNARHRPQPMVLCEFDISNHRENELGSQVGNCRWDSKMPCSYYKYNRSNRCCSVKPWAYHILSYHISYVHLPFQTRLITPHRHHHSTNWTKTPCVGTIWLVSRVVYCFSIWSH